MGKVPHGVSFSPSLEQNQEDQSMFKAKVFLRSIFLVSVCLFAISGRAVASENLQDGYGFSTVPTSRDGNPTSLGGGFDFLPNGDLIGLSPAPDFSSVQLVRIDANGDQDPAAPQVLTVLPAGILYGTFVKVVPSGDYVILAESNTSKIFSYHLETGMLAELRVLPGVYDAAVIDDEHMYLSTGSRTGTAEAWYWNWRNGSAPIRILTVTTGDAAAAGIATDDVGSLYYLKTSNVFPTPPQSHHLYRFTNEQIQNVLSGGPVLQISSNGSDGEFLATFDTAYNIQVNSFGDIFVSQTGSAGEPFGIFRVTPQDSENPVKPFLQFENTGAAFTSILAMEKKHAFFNPYESSQSRLALMFDDFENPKIYIATPRPSDSFADRVVGSQLQAPFNNPALTLGTPSGGGTENPDNSSIVSLTDGTGFITVTFDGGIQDNKQSRYGLDLIVFGNAFFSLGDPLSRFVEPAFIEVSEDLNHNGLQDDPWFLIAPNILPANLVTPYGNQALRHYADYTPTLILGDSNGDNVADITNMNPEDFYTIPDSLTFAGDVPSFRIDPGSGGGDAMDLRAAVFQTSPGVPFIEDGGEMRSVFLDQVDWVRATDAKLGDRCVGPCMAEIDAISIAKNQIVGEVRTVSLIDDLQPTIDNANEGDIVRLLPGTYDLSESIRLKPGVSLEGSYGLWTVNFEGDDTILRGGNLPTGQAAIVLTGNAPQLKQDYAIGGIHFKNCPVGITIQNLSVTVEGNFFTDTQTSLRFTSSGAENILVRKNIFGHTSQNTSSMKGAEVNGGKATFVQNVFVNEGVAISDLNARVYARNNIFSRNTVVFEQSASGASLFGHYNVFSKNDIPQIGDITLENNVTLNEEALFANMSMGDYRLDLTSPARGTGLGGSDPGVYDGPNFYPFDIQITIDREAPLPPAHLTATYREAQGEITLNWEANRETDLLGYHVYRSIFDPQNSSTLHYEQLNPVATTNHQYLDNNLTPDTDYIYYVTALDVHQNESVASNTAEAGPGVLFILDLPVQPLTNQGPNYLSGAYVTKMVLDFMGAYYGIDTLYQYGKQHNLPQNLNLPSVDPNGVKSALNFFDLPNYNFSVLARTNQNDVLKDMAFWISRDIPNVPVSHIPGAIPAFGDYNRWFLVKGLVTSENPHETSAYDVFGFWFVDPSVSGIGANAFKTAQEVKDNYLLPITNNDSYQGKYLSVLEPPEAKRVIQRVKRQASRLSAVGFLMGGAQSAYVNLAAASTTVPASLIVPVQEAAVEALKKDYFPYDKELARVSSELNVELPYFVKDARANYYLVPFSRQGTIVLVLVLDATDFHFREISVSRAFQYLPISKNKAYNLVFSKYPLFRFFYRGYPIQYQLIHETGTSFYYPTWELRIGRAVFHVRQNGIVKWVEGQVNWNHLRRYFLPWFQAKKSNA